MQRGHVVTSRFGDRDGGVHWGVDLGWDGGSGDKPVYAAQAGSVVYAGEASGFGGPDPAGWVVVDSPAAAGGGTQVYGHVVREVSVGDRVAAGQRIGRVNPNWATNGRVAPHLHFEWHRTVWVPPGGGRLNPLPLLDGARYPGEDVSTGQGEVPAMTLFGVDVSNHQGNFDFAAARAEGFVFASHKVTEGDYYRDPFWPRAREEMGRHFPGLFAGYHFARNDVPVERQADTLLAHLGDPSIPVQLDYEDTQTRGSGSNLRALIAEIEARGMRVAVNYLPRWYWQSMGRPDLTGTPPIWNSDYVNGSGYASSLYPGDHHKGWAEFHPGSPPVAILQFSEQAAVAGLDRVDVNAFRGSEAELRALLSGTTEEESMSRAEVDEIKQFIVDYVGPLISDVKDLRFEMLGSRDNPNYPAGPEVAPPGHPSLYDLRAGVPPEQAFHGTLVRLLQEVDAKTEALVRIAAKLGEAGEA